MTRINGSRIGNINGIGPARRPQFQTREIDIQTGQQIAKSQVPRARAEKSAFVRSLGKYLALTRRPALTCAS